MQKLNSQQIKCWKMKPEKKKNYKKDKKNEGEKKH
jgi:hypothetical protein